MASLAESLTSGEPDRQVARVAMRDIHRGISLLQHPLPMNSSFYCPDNIGDFVDLGASVWQQQNALPSVFESLKQQVKRECFSEIDTVFQSFCDRSWGFGSAEEYEQLLGDSQWVNSKLIDQFVSAVAVLRTDVFFITPDNCDFVCLNEDSIHWRLNFKSAIVSSKFQFFIAIVSLKRDFQTMRSAQDPGYHWIVAIGDVAKGISWIYDPMHNPQERICHDRYTQAYVILDRVFCFVKKRKIGFQKIENADFTTFCQQADGIHCGVWSMYYTLHWCVDECEYYQTVCRAAKNLPHLAVSLRRAICSDLLRHPAILDISLLKPRSPAISTTRPEFWTLTPNLNIASALQERCEGGRFIPADKLSMHRNVCFYSSGRHFAKVYRFSWPIPNRDVALLTSALHEAAATIAVCSKRPKWKFKVFGVVTQGAYASYVHICICRNMLIPRKVSTQEAIKEFLKILRKTGICHGDCHINNILFGINGVLEAFDFERCFVPIDQSDSSISSVIEAFVKAASHEDLKNHLPKFKELGLERTRGYFSKLALECLGSAGKLFALDKDALAETFWGQHT